MRTKLIIASVVVVLACRDTQEPSSLPERPGASHGGPALSASSVEFPVGSGPEDVAFDGANIWVANAGGGTVTKLRASDGAHLDTFTAGIVPNQLAFDGSNMWVADHASANVNKLRASDGANLGTFPVGTGPFGVTFDGANIWVAAIHTDDVTKLRASDGANLGTFTLGDDARQLAFDGTNMWVTHGSSSVTKLRASDGANLGTFTVGSIPIGVAFDGANIWVVNNGSNSVTKLRASDGTNLGTFSVGTAPRYVAFDGSNIWVSNEGSNNVTKLRARDGANLGPFPVGTNPQGMAFDGSSIWVANAGSNTVSKLAVNGSGTPSAPTAEAYQPNTHTLFYLPFNNTYSVNGATYFPELGDTPNTPDVAHDCRVNAGATTWSLVTGRFGKALQVNGRGAGDDQFSLLCANTRTNVKDFTFGYWIRTNQLPQTEYDVFTMPGSNSDNAGCFYFLITQIDAGGAPHTCASGVGATVSSSIADGRWHSIIWVVDFSNRRLRLYIDGTLNFDPGPFVPFVDPPYLASNAQAVTGSQTGSFALNGAIDDLWMEDHAWNAAEIARFYARDVVVLVHGFAGTPSSFGTTPGMRFLLERAGFSVDVFDYSDMTGFGCNFSFPIFADPAFFLGRELKTLKLQGRPIHVVAHSMGGLVTQAYMANLVPGITYGNEITDLIMVGTPHFGSPVATLKVVAGLATGCSEAALQGAAQIEELTTGSDFLWTLNSVWESKRPIKGTNVLGIAGIIGDPSSLIFDLPIISDGVVPAVSATLTSSSMNQVVYVPYKHADISLIGSEAPEVLANDPEQLTYKAVVAFLKTGKAAQPVPDPRPVGNRDYGLLLVRFRDAAGNPVSPSTDDKFALFKKGTSTAARCRNFADPGFPAGMQILDLVCEANGSGATVTMNNLPSGAWSLLATLGSRATTKTTIDIAPARPTLTLMTAP